MSWGFDFSQINLIPKKCIVNSRSECDTTINLGDRIFELPVMPANMECVINDEIAIKLAENKFFYIHHRFNVDAVEFTKKMRALQLPVSISIGVNEDAYKTIDILMGNNALGIDYVTIDIAHGHCDKMKNIIEYIKKFEYGPFIIAGNVSTPEAVRDLETWGANAIKVGIGPGAACTTYVATGFGSRGTQASAVQQCANARTNPNTKIIADGGIKEPGDIAKSLVLGADMVMIGGMFSALNDSPGQTVTGTDGRLYKEFWGSASAFQSGKKNRIEGTKKLMLMKHHGILDEMAYLKECLQSAISYGGGDSLHCFRLVNYMTKLSP
jgi:GMP reductase